MNVQEQNQQQSTVQSGNKPLEFNVVAEDDSGALTYKLRPTNGASGPHLKGNTIELPNGPDWYDITYHLVDNASRKIEFNTPGPFCAQVGADCPKEGSGNNSGGQLTQSSVGAKKLTLLNKNQDPPRQIGYILCFIDANTKEPVTPFDPIMDNGGGGRI